MAFALSEMTGTVIAKVVGLIVVLAILGATIGDVFTNMDLVVNEFATYTNVNSAVLSSLIPVFAIVVGIGIVLGIVGLTQRAADV